MPLDGLIAAAIGLAFGFIGSAPPAGPIAVLIIARAMDGRSRSAGAVAVGAALAELLYAALAFWGFSAYLAEYPWIVPATRAAAAVILLGLGIVLARRRPGAEGPPAPDRAGSGFVIGFAISGLNPTFLATWSAAVATLFATGLVSFSTALAVPFALGAGVGIVGWFGLLLWLVARYRQRFRRETLDKAIRVMGYVLVLIGLLFAARFVWDLTQGP